MPATIAGVTCFHFCGLPLPLKGDFDRVIKQFTPRDINTGEG